MNVKSFLILIIIALIALNIFSLVRFHKLKELKIVTQQIIKNDELNTYSYNLKVNILNSNLKIGNLGIKDSMNIDYPIKKVFDDKQEWVLVYRFSQNHCESCVDSSVQILRNWVDSIGINNMILLGNHWNNRIFNQALALYEIQGLNVYNSLKINIPTEELGYPYFFILDSNLQISNLFVPDKAVPSVTNMYLKSVSEKLKSNI